MLEELTYEIMQIVSFCKICRVIVLFVFVVFLFNRVRVNEIKHDIVSCRVRVKKKRVVSCRVRQKHGTTARFVTPMCNPLILLFNLIF